MPDPLTREEWAMLMRPPVVIAPDEVEAQERQWAVLAQLTPAKRMEMAVSMSILALRQRRERLRRQFPDADEQELRWAVVREALGMEPGTTRP